jgi:hypothetical protein
MGALVAAASVGAGSWQDRLAEIQRLRATVYLEEGAISPAAVTADGRFASPLDDVSWHLGLTGPNGEVKGCMRYTIYPSASSFEDLPFRNHPLAMSSRWSVLFRSAVESVVDRARRSGRAFAQAGMWALAEEARTGSNALRLVMATFALTRLLGDCYAICTATVKHHSAMILERLGATPLRYLSDELPGYYDPLYRSEMRILFFDSRQPHSRFSGMVAEILAGLRKEPVLLPTNREDHRSGYES